MKQSKKRSKKRSKKQAKNQLKHAETIETITAEAAESVVPLEVEEADEVTPQTEAESDGLQALGWSDFYEAYWAEAPKEGLQPARVIAEHRGAWRLRTADEECWGTCTGKMRHEANAKGDLPSVGDWVGIESQPDGHAVIHWVLPRKSKFSRKTVGESTEEQVVASNIDTIFLVNALNMDFNLRRLERYLVLAWESGAKPVVLLTKADLCDDIESYIEDVEGVAYGVPTHAISALEGDGLEQLEPYLTKGQSVALLGSSGAGKSTLLNALIGEELQLVKEVKERDHRGQHTTTARELFCLPNGAMIIDTPGMKELQLWHSEEGLQQTFDDIESYAEKCRFRDCQHHNEPGCAVRQAVENGDLTEDRLASYHKLQRELSYLARKDDSRMRQEEQKKWKQITVNYRKTQRFNMLND